MPFVLNPVESRMADVVLLFMVRQAHHERQCVCQLLLRSPIIICNCKLLWYKSALHIRSDT